MPKFLTVLPVVAVLCTCAALVFAQEAPPAPGSATPAATVSEATASEATPAPSSGAKTPGRSGGRSGSPTTAPATLPSGETSASSTPKPHRRSFFEWLFGSRHHKDTPVPVESPVAGSPTPAAHRPGHRLTSTPTPSATGKPSSTPKRTHGVRPEATPKPESSATPTPKPERTPKPKPESSATPTPKPEKTPKSATVTPAGATPTPRAVRTPKPKNTPVPSTMETKPIEPGAGADPEAQEQYRFEVAKTKALDDPEIKKLKDKADLAGSDDELRAASKAFNKALFEKIKKIDPSVSERADALEKAVLRRIGE